MILQYLWWQSTRDRQLHAFPLAQAVEEGRGFFEAVCTHSVPADLVVRDRKGALCLCCALMVGSQLADPGEARVT